MAVADLGGTVLGRPVVVDALDGHTFDDMFARHAEFRASDHAVIHDLYVVQVQPSARLTEPHGWCRVLATIPAATAFPPNGQGKMAP